MKVLNRPMFRMGGPIKEGIMSGIKEPRQGYRLGKGVDRTVGGAQMVFPAEINAMMPNNASKVFADVSNIYQAPVDSNLNTTDRFITVDRKQPRTNRIVKQKIENPDYIPKYKTITHPRFGDRRIEITEDMDTITNKTSGTEMPPMLDQSGKMGAIDEVIENKGKVETSPPDKQERVNTILESLGYDRAQKNALYDAMIKAGQRVSRGGLGAENLVSDVIAETSQSYDKPEKLREAANLMDVQQQLKLEQIKESKTNKNEEDLAFWTEQLGSKEKAVRYLTKDSQSSTEAYLAAKKATGSGLDGVKAGIEWMIRAGEVGPNENRGEISKKSHKNIKDFVKSDEFKQKGPGVYQLEGVVARIDADGSVEIVKSFGTISEKTNSWWGFGS